MFKKQWVQQVIIGVLIWIIGSAIWSFISNSFHIPGFNWSSVSFIATILFWMFVWQIALPFATSHLNLYIARQNLKFQREQLEYEEHKATLQASTAKEPLID